MKFCTQAMQSALGGVGGAKAGWFLEPGNKEMVARDLLVFSRSFGDSCQQGPASEGRLRRC